MVEPRLYAKYSDLQRTDNLFVLDKYLRLVKWKDDASVLDVGFGDGIFAMENLKPHLPDNFRKLVGCDINPDMLKFAKENYTDPKVDFLKLDISAEETPVELEGEFDHIFSFYTLHWVTKQRQTYQPNI
ncbi:hypothetical protein NQ317_016829 [Molorchus minor]|uniref:Methyltransferase domain-containing protein n=1 Tax=Molorchus minor TaxID=1323400 RepID=A0ABQ9JLT0_9CUCU|nr:hypothetical protein NQ317_016829 [Molorchus minor]